MYLGAFLVTTQVMMFYPYIKVPDPEVQDYIPIASPIAHVLAGLFVGFGTKVQALCVWFLAPTGVKQRPTTTDAYSNLFLNRWVMAAPLGMESAEWLA